ncbi:MAG: prenyltransferase/squalene oxidase repeat-containing protein [Chthoniobacteraceae bacterium]
MNACIRVGFTVLMIALAFRASAVDEPPGMEDAVRRGLALVVRAASNWQKNKTCFSCHHQTLPMLAMIESARAGLPADAAWLQSQTETTHRYFEQRIGEMDEGEHVPGGAATTGFGFWALSVGERLADKTTTAMVGYLLQIQGVTRLSDRKPDSAPKPEDGRWQASCRRAPMQASFIGDTVLVLIGLEKYATPEQRPRVAKAREAAERWVVQTPLRDQQDRLWRLWGLHHLGGDDALKQRTREAILAAQRDDGGWGEDKGRPSDAYSTGQTLFMLCKTGTAQDDSAALRARDYLLRTQLTDGSWLTESHVKTKAQPYFENGDPHGEHQFLSTAATAWATAALAQLLPPK